MKLSEYKGYSIEVSEYGNFTIPGVSGFFEKYQEAKEKIDKILKAESKENFPIEVVAVMTFGIETGTLTSISREEKTVWFTQNGKRSKEKILGYSGQPLFFKANVENLQLAKRHSELTTEINQLSKERNALSTRLIEPLTFQEVSK